MHLKYTGNKNEVCVHGDGEVVVHTTFNKGHHGEQIIVVRGSVDLTTLPPLDLKVLLGPCKVTLKGAKARKLATGAKLKLQAGSHYTVDSDSAIVLALPKPGPGLDDPPPPPPPIVVNKNKR